MWTQIRRAHVLFWTGLALLLALLPAGASAIQPADAAYRGDAHMGRRTATATFRVVHSHVVDFQLSGLDVQDTLVRLYPKWDKVEAADVQIAYVRRSLTNTFLNEKRRPSSRELVLDILPETHDPHDATDQLADRDEIKSLRQQLRGPK